jgi:hypothetical protein
VIRGHIPRGWIQLHKTLNVKSHGNGKNYLGEIIEEILRYVRAEFKGDKRLYFKVIDAVPQNPKMEII